MATAIEIYRKAYDLDYRKGDWQQAEELYKHIVEKFPYSDEKEYALIHLERIENLRANPLDQKLQPVSATGKGVNGFNIFNFILILALAVALCLGGYFIWQQNRYQHYQDMLQEGMFSEHIGNLDHAAERYKQAQVLNPGQSAAYRFLAELYLRQKQFNLAEIESKRWAIANPHDKALGEFRFRLQSALEAQSGVE